MKTTPLKGDFFVLTMLENKEDRKMVAALLHMSLTYHFLKFSHMHHYAKKIGCSAAELKKAVEASGFICKDSKMVYLTGEAITEAQLAEYPGEYSEVPWLEWEGAVLAGWSEVFPSLPFDAGHVRVMWERMGLASRDRFNACRKLLRLDFKGLADKMGGFVAQTLAHMLNRYVLDQREIKKYDNVPRALILLCRHYQIPARINLTDVQTNLRYEMEAVGYCKRRFNQYFRDHPLVFKEKLAMLLVESGAQAVLKGEQPGVFSSEDFWQWGETEEKMSAPEVPREKVIEPASLPDREKGGTCADPAAQPEKTPEQTLPNSTGGSAALSDSCPHPESPGETAEPAEELPAASVEEPASRAERALTGLEDLCRSLFCRQNGCPCSGQGGGESEPEVVRLREENLALRRQLDEMRRLCLEEREVGIRQLVGQLTSSHYHFVISKLYATVQWHPENNQALIGYSRNLFRALELLGLKPESPVQSPGDEFVIKRNDLGVRYLFEQPAGAGGEALQVRLVAPGWSWKGKTVVVPLVEPAGQNAVKEKSKTEV